ncbi:MAG TPA: chromosome segregation protein SMC [Gemmatimonadaceae bacterium]|nr:chromosome segregation protein SMC [Gemmatimonadaceae bacterium]
MRLSKLEMHGFKSFADRTELVFEPGVTAIVGPNGCGKSNVSDAVRWVLGEQSARALRGGKMEEVIFQGSSARRAVNIAEVSLHFENDEGVLPVPFREVVITRRLSRSGESEYLLNRAPCRLRDIHDLVSGTGLGADAGVVIETRMLDALLSDRPDDRRELFEEAAGVGLYRDRRRSTERRLEETAVDLSRLDDLVAEVQSQVRSLARQRKRSERHADLMRRRFTVELTLASREMAAWRDELARLEAQVETLRAQVPETEAHVARVEQQREDAHTARITAEGHRAEIARLVSAEQQHVMRLESEMRVAEERQRNAAARRARAEEEQRAGEQLGSRLAQDRAAAAAELVRLEAELETALGALDTRVTAEDEARRAVAAAREAFQRGERRLRELHDQAHRLELDGAAATREYEELTQRTDALAAEREQLAESLALARGELDLARRAMEEARATAEQAAEQLGTAREQEEAARAHESATRAGLMRADELQTSLQGKVQALEALERERVGLAPAAARLLRERERFGDGAILGPLSDFITTAAASAVVVEKFLGATVHAVLVRDRAAADAVREWHASANPGPLLLLPLDAPLTDTAADGSLASLVDAAEPARGWVRTLLGRALTIEQGSAFVDARGAVWLPGSENGPGPLRRRAELSSLRQELAASTAAREAAAADADAARAALAESERIVAAASEAAVAAQQQVRQATEQHEELARRSQRTERELANLEAQAERLSGRRRELAERTTSLDSQLAALTTTVAESEHEVTAARDALTGLEQQLETVREERTRAQVEQAQIQARLQVASDRERRLAAEVNTASSRLDALRSELGDIEQADVTLAQHMTEWRLDLEARQNALRDAEQRLADAEQAVQDTDAALENVEHALADARRQSTTVADALHHNELRLSELSGRRTAIRERLEAEWRRPLDEMLAELIPAEDDDDALRAELAALREELDSIGAVNPLAIEEHEEEVRRLDFLSTQRADLTAAKASLQQAIREIDITARELFLATFAQVRENFRRIFLILFGGGECDVRLENPEAPLDCDIEIHASPRGKRTQRIHLLSTGERTLVGLSLLFGIFLTKPSPFCLLDEVDGPLDDQNVGRFVRMLNEFKSKTQFIVITHNPRTTTEAADAVYGVTMQEPGVSSFVSVRLHGRAVEEAIGGAVGSVEGAGI